MALTSDPYCQKNKNSYEYPRLGLLKNTLRRTLRPTDWGAGAPSSGQSQATLQEASEWGRVLGSGEARCPWDWREPAARQAVLYHRAGSRQALCCLSQKPRGTRKLDHVSGHSTQSLPGCTPPSRTSGLATQPALTNEMWAEGAVTFKWKCLPFLPARTTGHVPVWSCSITGPQDADGTSQSCSRPFKDTQKQWEISLFFFFF